MWYPGEVYLIPPDWRPGGDPKDRLHVLLAECSPDAECATFAYTSTRSIEAAHNGANVLVNPTATRYQGTGFTAPTYVYPCRLVPVCPDDLLSRAGRIIDEMRDIRHALQRALGLDTGTGRGTGTARGSLRGQVVRLSSDLEREIGSGFALVVTDPVYSLESRYQNVVPILSSDEYEPGADDVIIGDQTTSWLAQADPHLAHSFLWTASTFAVWQKDEITAWSRDLTMDEATMADLDLALRVYFEI